MKHPTSSVQKISPGIIKPNPENPRVIFRDSDLNNLLQSIKTIGIQVPLTVYWDDELGSNVILDGERRWRCAQKLNLPLIPVIVQEKPSRLENLLMMFNIHNVRIAWDPLPMAMKLDVVRQLLQEQGKPSGIAELASITGLTVAAIRRAMDLLNLPEQYKDLLLEEAKKPREKQTITADLFLEISRSYNVIKRYVPEVVDGVSSVNFIDVMMSKYLSGVINNIIRFRDISKIARAELAGGSKVRAIKVLSRLISDPKYPIEDAYEDSVGAAYEERGFLSRIHSLNDRLDDFNERAKPTEEVLGELEKLLHKIQGLLRRNR